MAFDRDLAMKQLISIYRQSYLDILEMIADKNTNAENFHKSLMVDIDKKLQELDGATKKFKRQVVPKAYKQTQEEVLNYFKENSVKHAVDSSFAKVHDEAIKILQQNFYNNMSSALNFIGRRLDDQIREAQLSAVTKKVSTGQTIKEAKNELVKKLANQGMAGYRDSSGRLWRLDSYAEMSVRSVTAEATNKGAFNQLKSMDRDLVKLSSHSSPCELCSPLEGRVYSISGEHPDYPALDNALPNEYGIIHPSCRHRFYPYVPRLRSKEELERDLERSNKPFDEDPRSEKAKEAYKKSQKLNRYQRKEEKLTYELKGLKKGTDEYEKVSKQLEDTISKRRDLQREVQSQEAELIDGVWKIKEE